MAVVQVMGLGELEREFSRQAQASDRMRLAAAKALTWTAKASQEDLRSEMRRVFDRPTPWALNSSRIRSATPARLASEVFIKDEAFKSLSAEKWLGPEIVGGPRPQKRLEQALATRGLARYYAPTENTKLDRYGNPDKGLLQQIRSELQLARAHEYQNATPASRARAARNAKRWRGEFFAVKLVGGRRRGLSPGVYRRKDDQEEKVLHFIDPPIYSRRLDFYGVVQRSQSQRFSGLFDMALNSTFGGK
jgi:hypothetical protein